MENTYESWAFAQGCESAKRGDPAPEKDQCDPHFWAGFTGGQRPRPLTRYTTRATIRH